MSDSEADLFGDEDGSNVPLADQDLSDLSNGDGDEDVASDQDDADESDHRRKDARDHDNHDDQGQDENGEVKVKHIMDLAIHRHKTPRTSRDGLGFVCPP